MDAARKARRLGGGRLMTWVLVGLGGVAIAPAVPAIVRYAQARRIAPHAPDWALFAALSPQIKIHIIAAVAAFVLGIVILALPKGRGLHKALGWSWVAAMTATALSSLFITGLNGGFYSFIHLLSGWTLIALPMGIFAIRNRNVTAHRRRMTGIFVGGLLIAGALTFIPGRFMFAFFF